jgi:hypothetical protein
MRSSVLRVLLFSLFGIVLAGFTAREMVQANQVPSEPVALLASSLDAIERGDQANTLDCAALNRVVMQADVAALGIKVAKQSQPAELSSAIANLQGIAHRLDQLTLQQPKLQEARLQYRERLQTVLQGAADLDPARLARSVADLNQFSRDKILLDHCASS